MTSTSSSVSDRSGRTTPKQSGQDLREKLSLWESSLATLSDRQKDGVMTLSAVANSRPIPKDVSVRWNVTAGKQLRCCSNLLSVHLCTDDSLKHRPMSSRTEWNRLFLEDGTYTEDPNSIIYTH